MELMSTLNMDYEISKSLYSLYDYMLNRLIEANLKKMLLFGRGMRIFKRIERYLAAGSKTTG